MNSKQMVIQQRMKRGEDLFIEGKIDQAEEVFLDLLNETPRNPEILNNLGVIQHFKGNKTGAKEYFIKVLSQNKDHFDALINLDILSQNELGFHKEPGSVSDEKDERIGCNLEKTTNRSKKPKVSVGIPVYNGEQHIAHTIESILEQDFTDFELIISDNHSNDNTAQICCRFESKDNRVKYFQYPSNVGGYRNFGRVFELSSGDYFMWASADDIFEKDYIGSLVEVLEKNPSVALCYSATNLIDTNGLLMRVYKDKFDLNINNASQRYRNLIYGLDLCNCLHGLIRSSVLVKTKLMQTDVVAGDCLLLAEIALKGKFVQLQKPMFNRRRFSRNETLEDRYARSYDMCWPHSESKKTVISLPICKMIKAHVDVINDSNIEMIEKESLIAETYHCFLNRFANWIQFEIGRAIKLIHMGVFQHAWGQPAKPSIFHSEYKEVEKTYIYDLLSEIEYALFLIPEYPDLHYARSILLLNLGRFEEARIALLFELGRNPGFEAARNLLKQLESKISKGESGGSPSLLISER